METRRRTLPLFAWTAILSVLATSLFSLAEHDVRQHWAGSVTVQTVSPSLHHGVWIRFELRDDAHNTAHAVWYLCPWRDVVTEL